MKQYCELEKRIIGVKSWTVEQKEELRNIGLAFVLEEITRV
jgi:hypothetical protein